VPLRIGALAYTHYESDPRVRREAEALAARGDDVTVWALAKEGLPATETINGVHVKRIPMGRYRGGQAIAYIGSYLRFLAEVGPRLSSLHFEAPFDIVHVHTMPDFMVFAALLPRLFGAKVVLDMHDLMPDLFALKFENKSGAIGLLKKIGVDAGKITVGGLRLAQDAATTFADAVICVHSNQYELLLRDGVPAHKLAIVMNAADPTIFPPRQKEPPIPKDGPIEVVYHGTILHRYGVDLAVRAFAAALKQEPRLRFSIYGGGDFVPELRQLVADLGLPQDKLQMTGEHMPLDRIAAKIRDAHIGLVPNRDDHEDSVLPTKLLEYLSIGVPAIASRTRCVSRFFDDTQVELVDVGDVEGMTAALIKLTREGKRRNALVKAGHAWQADFGFESQKKLLFRVFDELVHDKVVAQKRAAQAAKEKVKTGKNITPPKGSKPGAPTPGDEPDPGPQEASAQTA
jgi:glycosyltransferase involved in cell wall biosynthesis